MSAVFDYQNGQVCVARSGAPLGGVDDGEVKAMLRACTWDDMTDALRKAVSIITYDYEACPRCGCKEHHEQQDIDGVKFGFCRKCMYTIHIDTHGRWHGYPERAPYRIHIDKLAS